MSHDTPTTYNEAKLPNGHLFRCPCDTACNKLGQKKRTEKRNEDAERDDLDLYPDEAENRVRRLVTTTMTLEGADSKAAALSPKINK